jgi:hypothetical protein
MFIQIWCAVVSVASHDRCIDGAFVWIYRSVHECVTEQNLSLNKVILFIQISAVAHDQSSAFTYLLLCLCLIVADKGLYNSSLSWLIRVPVWVRKHRSFQTANFHNVGSVAGGFLLPDLTQDGSTEHPYLLCIYHSLHFVITLVYDLGYSGFYINVSTSFSTATLLWRPLLMNQGSLSCQ